MCSGPDVAQLAVYGVVCSASTLDARPCKNVRKMMSKSKGCFGIDDSELSDVQWIRCGAAGWVWCGFPLWQSGSSRSTLDARVKKRPGALLTKSEISIVN